MDPRKKSMQENTQESSMETGDEYCDRNAGDPMQRHETEWYEHYPSAGLCGRACRARANAEWAFWSLFERYACPEELLPRKHKD